MAKKPLKPLKDANYPLNKPDVVANAVSVDIPDPCVAKLHEELPDKTYHTFQEIKENLPQDGASCDTAK